MAYRDDEHALQTKKAEIEGRLQQIEAQRRELEDLTREEADLGKELADVNRRLEEKRRLPLLSRVEVAAPCPADWASMVGDDRTRFCPSCEKNVYNLSALTAQEAEQLIREKEGNLCVRYFQRKDGTVMTDDCPVGVRRRRVRRSVAAAAVTVGAVGAGVAGLMAGAQFVRDYDTLLLDYAPERKGRTPEVMGELTQEQFLMRDEMAGKAPKKPGEKP
ncbi:hypothetical protein [Polyangium sp. y55x31]|uniref:hypothetical protein n=1 Tax=Polyangium sp. y55x31 TaxID=3042688 RepID=UPI0024830E3C|nr:hypothetical protein [Polyangium sp. y55x31]MDI1482341.1 hypothetical protein [Polyangium sp. y55x31]